VNEDQIARLIRAAWDEQPPNDLDRIVAEARRREQLSAGERESRQSLGRSRPVKASMHRAMLEPVELEELYVEHRDMMWRTAQRVLKGQVASGVSAEDIVMTVMAELAQKGIPDDEDGRPFNLPAYLRRCVFYRAIDALRRAERLQALDPARDLTDSTSADPHTAAESHNFLPRFDELLRKLSANERYVFQERVLNGRPAKDVARELGVSPPRVSQLVTAALKKLKDGLREDHDVS
jgi:RNA polymerase sigma factor (sigma-70 family)